ncbi:TIR domain-containing protein [Thauera phenylacetica]
MTTTKPRVFIGSSSEAKKVAEAIHRNLDHDCFCEIWTHGIFGVGTYPLEALIEQANKADYAIMVLHPDDVTRSRGKQSQAPRDNVIFELGLFIGKLGKGRTCFVAPRGVDVKIPSDLVGLTPAAYDPKHPNLVAALGPACAEIREAIEASTLRRYGLERIGFFEEFNGEFETLFKTAKELTTFFIHSRRWREMNNDHIRSFLKRAKTKLTVVLPNMKNADLISRLEKNFEDGPQLRSFIIDAYRYFGGLRKEFGSKVRIFDFDFYPTYSFYRFDKTCIMAMYPTTAKKQAVPTFGVVASEGFGEFVDNDLKLLLERQKPKTDTEIKRIIT